MPDVLTHLLVGLSIALLVRSNGPRSEQMLIVLGALLIDVERPITWLLESTPFYWIGISSAFHSILGAVIMSYVAAACFDFKNSDFRKKSILVFIGCTSHLLLDLVMYPWAEVGLYLFYPIKIAFSFNFLWPDFWWFPLIGVTCLLGAFIIRYVISLRILLSTK